MYDQRLELIFENQGLPSIVMDGGDIKNGEEAAVTVTFNKVAPRAFAEFYDSTFPATLKKERDRITITLDYTKDPDDFERDIKGLARSFDFTARYWFPDNPECPEVSAKFCHGVDVMVKEVREYDENFHPLPTEKPLSIRLSQTWERNTDGTLVKQTVSGEPIFGWSSLQPFTLELDGSHAKHFSENELIALAKEHLEEEIER